MLHTHHSHGETPGFLPFIAADDPVGSIPDLQPVIHDFERDHARNQRRQQKNRSERPPEPPPVRKAPDQDHQVDDYA